MTKAKIAFIVVLLVVLAAAVLSMWIIPPGG